MAASRSTAKSGPVAFSRELRSILASVPTPDERRELLVSIQDLKAFLDELASYINALPDQATMDQATSALDRIEELADLAKSRRAVSRFFGDRSSARPRPIGTPRVKRSPERADLDLSQLRTMPLERVRTLLESDATPVGTIRRLARELALASPDKTPRQVLAQQIYKSIANRKGYESLGQPAIEASDVDIGQAPTRGEAVAPGGSEPATASQFGETRSEA